MTFWRVVLGLQFGILAAMAIMYHRASEDALEQSFAAILIWLVVMLFVLFDVAAVIVRHFL